MFRYKWYFAVIKKKKKILQDWAWVLPPPCGHSYYLEFRTFTKFVHLNLSFRSWTKTVLDVLWSFPGGSEVKASACNAGDLGSIPRWGRSPGEGNGNPLQNSCLENPMDRGAWWAIVHGVANSRTRLSHFTFRCP